MKKLAIAFAAVAMPVLAMAQSSVLGTWVTEPSEETGSSGYVEIAPCGQAVCGVLVGNSAGTATHTGETIIANMQTTDGIDFSGGTITDPVKQKTYKSKMKLDGNTLYVSGCFGPICRQQTWTRK